MISHPQLLPLHLRRVQREQSKECRQHQGSEEEKGRGRESAEENTQVSRQEAPAGQALRGPEAVLPLLLLPQQPDPRRLQLTNPETRC